MRTKRQPPKMILLNTLDATDFGIYNDYISGYKMGIFKKLGIDIRGGVVTGTADSPVIPASVGTLASNIKVSKSCTDDGKYASLEVLFAPPAPCTSCDWEYGLTFREKVKLPGVGNSKNNLQQKSYVGVLKVVEATSTTIDAAYILAMENDLMDQIHNDIGLHNQNTDALTKMSGAIVNVFRGYYVTTTNANTDKILITTPAGLTETIDLDGGATIITAVNDFNDDNSYDLAAIAVSSTVMLVTGPAGYKYTLADGAGASTCTFVRKMLFTSKDLNVQFDLIYGDDMGGTTRGVWITPIIGTTITTSGARAYVDGVAMGAAATVATNVAALSIELIADLTAGAVGYAGIKGAAGETVYVYTNTDLVTDFNLTLSAASTCTLGVETSPWGRYPSLTSDDIFRMFWNKKDQGSLARGIYLDQPLQGIDYCVYTIAVGDNDISGLHGANYDTKYTTEYVIAVRKSLVDDDLWDKTNSAATGARYSYMQESTDDPAVWAVDSSFEDLLEILVGTAVENW